MSKLDRWKITVEQWKNNTYKNVQDLFDAPHNKSPAPSKISGAALEFESTKLGDIVESKLSLSYGVAEVKWDCGVALNTFVGVYGAVQIWFYCQSWWSAYISSGSLDGGQWEIAAMERWFPLWFEYAIELLACLNKQSFRTGIRIYQLALEE